MSLKVPIWGRPPYYDWRIDAPVFMVCHMTAYGFVIFGLPNLNFWQTITVYTFGMLGLFMTYHFERLRRYHNKTVGESD
jgi:hypothetical protein